MPSSSAPIAALRILLVEDQSLDAELMIRELKRSGFASANVIRVESPADFTRELGLAPDVILCDYALPAFSAPEALRIVQQRQLDIPFIVVSGSIGEEIAVEAIKHGADDYLLKDRLGRLGAAVSQAVQEKKLRDATRRAENDLRQSEYKYRCLFEHLPDAAYLCDSATGRIIDTNRRGESLLGLDRAGVLGLRLSHFMPAGIFRALLAIGHGHPETSIELAAEVTGAEKQPVSARIHAGLVPIYNRQLLLVFVRPISPDNTPGG